ncbi:hypothetical protein [Candidatus Neptunichlamydia sp. REUL1]|nr:hypothetical protein [Candidatus Neptunochlamydia sp. REUL1]
MIDAYHLLQDNGKKKLDDEIRDDPEWHNIMELPEEVYNNLKNTKFDS